MKGGGRLIVLMLLRRYIRGEFVSRFSNMEIINVFVKSSFSEITGLKFD